MTHPYPTRHPVPSSHSTYIHPQIVTTMPESVLYSSTKLEHINCIHQPTHEYGGLYLGDIITIIKPEIIPNYKIGAVLSCLTETNYSSNLPSSLVRKIVPAKDSMDYPLNIHFDECNTFIETMRKQKKNVLVHCHAGVSRSAAILCAYLMRKNQWSCQQAVNFLKKRRNRVKPNQNFLKLLKQYEKQLPKNLSESSNLQRSESFSSKRQPINSGRHSQARNSFDPKQQRHFLSVIENQSTLNFKNNQMIKPTQSIDQFDSQQGSRFSFRMSLKDNENKNIKNQHKSVHKGNTSLKNTKVVKKEECSFGEQFKNKISALLGRKTRIAWQLASKGQNIDFEDEKVSINCI